MRQGERRGYPSDVTDEEWALVAPYLALCREDASQRDYPLRDVFNGLRYVVACPHFPHTNNTQLAAAVAVGK